VGGGLGSVWHFIFALWRYEALYHFGTLAQGLFGKNITFALGRRKRRSAKSL